MRVPADWKTAIEAGRLLLLSPFDSAQQRMTRVLSHCRNEFVTAHCDEIFIIQAAPGGKTAALARQAEKGARPVQSFNDG